MPKCAGVDIEEATIQQLQHWLHDGQFSSRDLTVCYLVRIRRLNNQLRAVIEINPDALEIAERMDQERKNGKIRGSLHGIPCLVKDNIANKDKMQTTAGSKMLVGSEVPEDAHVVQLLRNAGAILLGHANMSEWVSMRSTYYAEGYSSRGGKSRNPYNLAEHPGGSSSGSAIAFAANMCAFSIGTETDGSVIFPADRNGVVGIKPTLGLTSCHGVIPESRHFDIVGVFRRSVADAAIALNAICDEPESESTPGRISSDVCGKEALKGAKFGLPWKRIWEKTALDEGKKSQYAIYRSLIQRIENAGATVISRCDIPSAEETVPPGGCWDWDSGSKRGHPEQSEYTVVKVDFYNDLKGYLDDLVTNLNRIECPEDVIAYNIKHTSDEGGIPKTHPAWPTGQDSLDQSAASKGVEDGIYWSALAYVGRKSRDEGINAALLHEDGSLDGLLVPVQGDDGVAVQIAAQAGYPMITMPVGVDTNGVPFGLAIIHKAFNENILIRFGSAIEDLVSGLPKPRFRNKDADGYLFIGAEPESTS
ncbi:amidase family protein [Pseudomassariella vexata]|uniref:Amidase family protein n=1 Tax=Pseudomassariella vexata TaxID=1141098 RepID=A0A1Y2E037_9PEZI|nr:amidase family protein [Pseudomassariella vexata]ORY64902.1 amidase family protein [Pseudomassariella vexata]